MATSPTLPAVIMFDLDGTLVDTMQAFADLAAEVMESRHRLPRAAGRARYLETSGIPFCQQLEVIFPGDARNTGASDEFEKRKLAICEVTPMDERTIRGLTDLRTLGLKLVVSSNTGQTVVDDFATREAFRFDLALGFDPARGLAKGRPHVQRALDTFGVGRDRFLYVGDSLADGRLADESGVPFIGRLGTFRREDFLTRDPRAVTIPHVGDLPALLRARVEAA